MQSKLPKAIIKLLQKADKDRIACRVVMLDLHDDNLISVTVLPPRTRRNSATIEFELEDDATRKTKLLTFIGCGNLRLLLDFDVLADNWSAQTSRVTCLADARNATIPGRLAHSQEAL